MHVIFILVLFFGDDAARAAAMVRVGGFDSYSQCMQQGTKTNMGFECIPVNHP